jgi:3-dehydrosphinganine reductase
MKQDRTTTPGHAIITGGSSGIGKSLAKRLLRSGWNVSIIARTAALLDAAREELEILCSADSPNSIETLVADVTNARAIEASVDSAVATLGAPALVVSSAGIAEPGYFRDIPLESHYRTMQVNYFGSLHLVRAVLPHMKALERSNLVLISSGAGLMGLIGYASYSPSKFALKGLAEALRKELKDMGVMISVAYPPDTDTPQLAKERETKPWETSLVTETARLWSADDVADVILRGVARGKFTITPGWEMTALARFGSLLYPILQWHFDRTIAKETAKSASTKER